VTATTARGRAIQQRDDSIQRNVQKIEEAKRPAKPNALMQLAMRLNVEPGRIERTLRQTVFKNANDEEFAALVIVANEYDLNPLLKQMYAFPKKGGGIEPMISIDGWIHIMNRHPDFDGIEFNDIPDEAGKLIAIEAVIYSKSRSRPTKITEYLDECERPTDPWKKSPARMLRHRALIQCVRVAFGVTAYTEDDVEIEISNSAASSPPMRQATLSRDGGEYYDPSTGVVDRDAGAADDPEPSDDRQYDDQTGREIDPREAIAEEVIAAAQKAATIIDLNGLRERRQTDIDALPEELAGPVNKALREAETRLKGGK
jgi:phage recombination protein Bet